MAGKWGRTLAGLLICACALPATAGAATIEVTTHKDELDGTPDSNCSLREAVQAANSNTAVGGCPKGGGPSDTITLEGGRYSLKIPTTNEDANVNGDLDVDGNGDKLIFRGEGAASTDIRTSLADRIVDIHDATPRDLREDPGPRRRRHLAGFGKRPRREYQGRRGRRPHPEPSHGLRRQGVRRGRALPERARRTARHAQGEALPLHRQSRDRNRGRPRRQSET